MHTHRLTNTSYATIMNSMDIDIKDSSTHDMARFVRYRRRNVWPDSDYRSITRHICKDMVVRRRSNVFGSSRMCARCHRAWRSSFAATWVQRIDYGWAHMQLCTLCRQRCGSRALGSFVAIIQCDVLEHLRCKHNVNPLAPKYKVKSMWLRIIILEFSFKRHIHKGCGNTSDGYTLFVDAASGSRSGRLPLIRPPRFQNETEKILPSRPKRRQWDPWIAR